MLRLAAVLPLLPGVLAAWQSGEVRGRVVDSRSNEPLALVQVQLSGSATRTVTDREGAFRLAALEPGDYALHVSTVGYHLLRQPFTLAAGEIKQFEVVLTPSTDRRTDSVEVTAEPFELARQDSPSELTLAGNEMKNLASVLADDPLRAVQAMPGVTSNNDFNSEFSLRGAVYQRIGLYLDGVLLHAPFHMVEGAPNSGSLTVFNGDMLENISLHGGAWPVRYADRTAGILDVTTREGSRRQVMAHVTASASNAGVMAEGPLAGGRGSWIAGARKSYLEYIISRTSDDPTLAFGFTDGHARLSYDLTAKHNLSLSVLEGYSSLDRSSARSRLGINSVMTGGYHTTLATFASRWTPDPKFLLRNRGSWMRESGDTRNLDGLSLGAEGYAEWAGASDATWIWTGANALDFGASVRRLRDDGSSNRYQFNPFAVRPLDRFRGSALRPGGYAQQTVIAAAGRIVMSAGLRWDTYSVADIAAVSPHASIAVQPGRSTRIQLGWGQYVQYAELNSLYSMFGRTSLLPERATHYEVSIDQRIGDRTRVRVELYDRLDRDLLARPLLDPRLIGSRIFNPPVNALFENSVRGYSRGAQVFLQRRSANRLSGWISYAYGHARLRDGMTRASYPADHDQRHTVSIFGCYRLRPTVNLSVRWSYGSGFPVPGFFQLGQDGRYYLSADRNAVRMETYDRADARINKAFVYDRWKLTLFAEVINLFNRTNRRFDSFNGYNSRTGMADVRFDRMIPILPSAGIVFEL